MTITYKQVKDVFQRVKDFRRELRDHLEASQLEMDDERLSWLVEHMDRHERFIDGSLDRYEEKASEGILETWLQYVPDAPIREAFEETRLEPGTDEKEVFERIQKWDQALLEMYRQLAGMSGAPRVQELFQSLLEMEEAKQEEISWRWQQELQERAAGSRQ